MPLEIERACYKAQKAKLLEHHQGRYALIVGEELLGVYDDPEVAYKAGVAERGNVPMLIQHILPDEPTESAPALMLGLCGHP